MKKASPTQLLFAAVAIAGMYSSDLDVAHAINFWWNETRVVWHRGDAPLLIPKSADDPWYAENGWDEVE